MRPRIRLSIEREALRVELRRFRQVLWRHTMPVPSAEPLVPRIQELLGSSELRRGRVVDLVLDRPPLQRRLLSDLPPVNRRALAAMVAVQSPRIFRKNGNDLITDAHWVTDVASPGRRAACVALDGHDAASLVQAVGDAGRRLRSLSVGGEWAGYGLDLRPPDIRRIQGRAQWATTIKVAAAVGIFWVVAMSAAALTLVRDDRRVSRELMRLGEPRAAVLAARRSIDSAAGMVRTIEDAERTRWSLADQVSWLSSTLPDSAFLTELELWGDGSGRATGWARRPLEVQPVLERATSGERIRFEATAARQSRETEVWEGFSLAIGKVR